MFAGLVAKPISGALIVRRGRSVNIFMLLQDCVNAFVGDRSVIRSDIPGLEVAFYARLGVGRLGV